MQAGSTNPIAVLSISMIVNSISNTMMASERCNRPQEEGKSTR